ncbi:MAG: outer membrane protein assembly factor BamC [Gammaproteobacteria bacterium]
MKEMLYRTAVRPCSPVVWLILSLLLISLAGCSGEGGFVRERKVDYRKATTLPRLDVPPDLSQVESRGGGVLPPTTALGTSTYSGFATSRQAASTAQGSGVLPRPESIRVEHDGARRWLVIDAPPERVWPQVREFWLQQGFLIKWEDPRLGIIETDWMENRADIPQGIIRRLFSKIAEGLYSAPTRDKYRVRLERGDEPDTTELFLSHWGVKEAVSNTADVEQVIWEPRPSDPELEAEFLNRLLVFMGLGEEQATQRLAAGTGEPRARIVQAGGEEVLEIDEAFSRAWRLTGIALDHLGFVVEDRDRSQGIYRVRATEPLRELTEEKGFFSGLAFWRDDEEQLREQGRFLVLVSDRGETTRITIRPEKSELPKVAEAADRILALLEEQLR